MHMKNVGKRTSKWIGIIALTGFIIAQFFRPERENPSFDTHQSIWADTHLTSKVKSIFQRSCINCHSFETDWPWYSNISPISWWIAHHVESGRKHLNFSTWLNRPPEKRISKLESIMEEVHSNRMPMPSYLLLHDSARLSKDDITVLEEWIKLYQEQVKTLRANQQSDTIGTTINENDKELNHHH